MRAVAILHLGKESSMKIFVRALLLTVMVLSASQAQAEILALLNYETKPEQIVRKEGLAVVDVDPKSPSFGKLLMEIPLPPDLVAHHIYFNRDKSKAYITALGKRSEEHTSELQSQSNLVCRLLLQ